MSANTASIIIGMENQSEPVQLQKIDPFYKEANSIYLFFDLFLIIARVSRWEAEEHSSRKNGWGADYEKTFTPQTFGFIPRNYTIEEFEIWIRRHRLDDLQRRIAVADFEQNDADIRSPSPEPIYDPKTGLRMNTRDQRLKDKYYKERNRIVSELVEMDPSYIAPPDYKPPKKFKKIPIPDPDNPMLNYIGQIIGPGGTTQQKLERESKCKIQIRGHGSQNKNKIYNKEEADENEPLYVLVTANTDDHLAKGCAMIEAIILQTDEDKKYQMVAYDHLTTKTKKGWCENCGEQGHKFYECPERLLGNTSNIYCNICGSTNHPSADCPENKKKKQQAEEITPEEELHIFLQTLKEEKEQKAKFKAITASGEGPRLVSYAQFQAEQEQKTIQNQQIFASGQPNKQLENGVQNGIKYGFQAPPAVSQYYSNDASRHVQSYQTTNYNESQTATKSSYVNDDKQIAMQQAPQLYQQQSPSIQIASSITEPINQNGQHPEDSQMEDHPDLKSNQGSSNLLAEQKSDLTKDLFLQQQQVFQSTQQTQIGAQSTFKSYKQEVRPPMPGPGPATPYQYGQPPYPYRPPPAQIPYGQQVPPVQGAYPPVPQYNYPPPGVNYQGYYGGAYGQQQAYYNQYYASGYQYPPNYYYPQHYPQQQGYHPQQYPAGQFQPPSIPPQANGSAIQYQNGTDSSKNIEDGTQQNKPLESLDESSKNQIHTESMAQ
eukprot:403371954